MLDIGPIIGTHSSSVDSDIKVEPVLSSNLTSGFCFLYPPPKSVSRDQGLLSGSAGERQSV